MRRSRWTRSSLLVPALLIELAAETGTLLRGMNAVMCHDEVVVAAGAMARVLMLLQLQLGSVLKSTEGRSVKSVGGG